MFMAGAGPRMSFNPMCELDVLVYRRNIGCMRPKLVEVMHGDSDCEVSVCDSTDHRSLIA